MPKWKSSPGRQVDREGAALDEHARALIGHLDVAMRRLLLVEHGQERGIAEAFSRQEIAVVDTLGAEGPLTMGELAGRVRLPLSTATRVVDRLVVRALVQRERPEDNRRVVRVALATAGRAFFDAALAARIAGARAMLQRLSDPERRELIRLFWKIAASVAEESKR